MGFRIGGDEFAIILKSANRDIDYKIVKKIKLDISEFEFIYNDKKSFFVDVSIGVYQVNKSDTIEIALKKVDELLYKSKNNGKGMITIE